MYSLSVLEAGTVLPLEALGENSLYLSQLLVAPGCPGPGASSSHCRLLLCLLQRHLSLGLGFTLVIKDGLISRALTLSHRKEPSSKSFRGSKNLDVDLFGRGAHSVQVTS